MAVLFQVLWRVGRQLRAQNQETKFKAAVDNLIIYICALPAASALNILSEKVQYQSIQEQNLS